MDKWFHKQHKLVQILLLFIPFINWIMEIGVRWSAWAHKGGILRLIICIIVTIPSGIIIGWLDMLWVLFFNKLCAE